MLSGVMFLLDFFMVCTSLYSTVGIFISGHEWLKSSKIILLDGTATQKVKQKKITSGLDFYFGSLQFTPDKYVCRI